MTRCLACRLPRVATNVRSTQTLRADTSLNHNREYLVLQRLIKGTVLGEYCGTVKTVAEHLAEVGEEPDDLGYLHHDKSFDMPPYPEDRRDTALEGYGRDLKLIIDGGCKGNRLAFINDIENTQRDAGVKAVRPFSV
jgi:hypothetical protein